MITDLRHLLAIYVHAHQTGNSVPPHIDAEARAALADEPAVPEGREPGAADLEKEFRSWWKETHESTYFGAVPLVAVLSWTEYALARWGNLVPAPVADGEVTELVAWLQDRAETHKLFGVSATAAKLDRAAELLQRQALVPVPVSDALIKAECALSDIAEGEPMTDEGDPLQWAERRCADTLAIIRPTMRQHKIRTSEWPPVPAHALPLPEVNNG